MIDWSLYPNFKREEFDSHDAPGSGDNMCPATLARLQALRWETGLTMRINSGYRTSAHNGAEGGQNRSAHLQGRAADISTVGWTETELMEFITEAKKLGFTGLGMGNGFVHLDDMTKGEGYQRPLCWKYVNGKPEDYREWV